MSQFARHVQATVARHDVRYWTYINQDWNKHGWGQGWGDSRVQATAEALGEWKGSVFGPRTRYLCRGGRPCSAAPTPLKIHFRVRGEQQLQEDAEGEHSHDSSHEHKYNHSPIQITPAVVELAPDETEAQVKLTVVEASEAAAGVGESR